MNTVNSVWVVTDKPEAVNYLVSAARAIGKEITLVFADGVQAIGAKKAYRVDGECFAECIPEIVKFIKQSNPDLILTDTSKNGRLFAGLAAAALNVGILSDVMSLSVEDGITGDAMVYGGTAVKHENVTSSKAVVVLGQGVFPELTLDECPDVTALDAKGSGIRFVGKTQLEGKKNNLKGAKNVIAVGRGAGKAHLMDAIFELGSAIDAEIGCTRPVAEEDKLMPRETYIGVSGLMLKPEFCLCLCSSGQIQHTVGINRSGTVIAINKDKNAPIFKQCDYGLIADIEDVLPKLLDRLK